MPSQKIIELVQMKIKGKKVMVFSKTWCGFCNKAKTVLKQYLGKELSPEDYEIMELDNEADGGEIQEYLAQITGARSVPRVFINGNCIGGGDETASLHSQGKLKKMLTE